MLVAGGAWEWPMLRGRHFAGLEQWAFLGVFPVAAAVVGAWFVHARQPSRFLVAFASSAVLMLAPFAAFGSAVFNRGKAAQPLLAQADALRLHEDLRIGCWDVGHLPSLNFYARRNVQHLDSDHGVVEFLKAGVRVYLFIPSKDWQRFETQIATPTQIVARHYDFYHHTELLVVTNRP
jgi:hypothetical protein